MTLAREAELLTLIVELRTAVARNEALLRTLVDNLPTLQRFSTDVAVQAAWRADREAVQAGVARALADPEHDRRHADGLAYCARPGKRRRSA